MGEITDMILEGTLCEICGVYIDDDEEHGHEVVGYPRTCTDCSGDEENADL